MDDATKRVSAVLTDNDIEIVRDLEGKLGISFSAALRIVIREWAQKCQITYRAGAETTSLPEN